MYLTPYRNRPVLRDMRLPQPPANPSLDRIESLLTCVRQSREGQRAETVPHGQRPQPATPPENRAAMRQGTSFRLYGATEADRRRVLQALDALPESVRRSVAPLIQEIHVVDTMPPDVEGAAFPHTGTILLHRGSLNEAEDQVRLWKAERDRRSSLLDGVAAAQTDSAWTQTLLHETAHLQDFALGSRGRFRSEQVSGPLGQGPFVSAYAQVSSARGQPWEDCAETAALLGEMWGRHRQGGGDDATFVRAALRHPVYRDKFGYILKEHWQYPLEGVMEGDL